MSDAVVKMLSRLTDLDVHLDVHRGETDRGGRTLRWVAAGEGTPTVFLEAGLGEPVPTWAPVFAELARISRVVAYDRAGIGLSDPVAEVTYEGWLADLAAVIEDTGSVPCVLVGHSLGGLLAQAMAWLHADLLAGLVLIDPSHEDAMQYVPQDIRDQLAASMLAYASMTVEDFLHAEQGFREEQAVAVSEDRQIQGLVNDA